MAAFDRAEVRRAYGTVADRYAAAFADDLEHLALDREVLDAAAGRLTGRGTALDVGCGPAQVAAYLTARGATVVGCDLVPAMLTVARRRYPAMPLVASDVCQLAIAGGSCAGAVAFYSLHHLPRRDLARALAEIRRVIAIGGAFVACTHLGAGDVHVEDFLGERVDMDAALYEERDFVGSIERAGFVIDDVRIRGPAPGEADTRRVYVTSTATGVP